MNDMSEITGRLAADKIEQDERDQELLNLLKRRCDELADQNKVEDFIEARKMYHTYRDYGRIPTDIAGYSSENWDPDENRLEAETSKTTFEEVWAGHSELQISDGIGTKPSNPKDGVGIRKWRQFMTVPRRVMWEVGIAMMEGAMKYGRHNYRVAGVQASVYADAAIGHIDQWIEGEDNDPDTGLNHISKAIASLVVLRDGMLQGNFTDDRPPRHEGLEEHRAFLQERVDALFEKHPDPKKPFTEGDI